MKKTVLISFIITVLMSAVAYLYIALKDKSEPLSELDRIDTNLIEKDSEYKLVFFGYAGCYHFCDPKLREIDAIYKEIRKYLDVKMVFIDISQETTYKEAKLFVKDVNSEFEAINPNDDEIASLQKKFQDVYIKKLPESEYLHSGFLYLLKRQNEKYYLLKIYLEFMNTDAVVADIKKITDK